MASQVVNYYEYLNVPQDAPLAIVQKAYDDLAGSTQTRLINPLTMQSALDTQNTILPGIRRHLLSGPQARAAYDQQLARTQQQQRAKNSLADDEGLDDVLPRPFLFDLYHGYDTETPAFTLREIAHKLDNEWQQASAWLADTSDINHVFVGFLTYVANRSHLAQRIARITAAVSTRLEGRMHVNEGIERCIAILDPEIERPDIAIYSPEFDGKVFEAGEFIADQQAMSELILEHASIRGCAYGSVESRTDWVRFHQDQEKIFFTLMPDGTDSEICASKIMIPIFLHVRQLQRNQEHTAELVVRVESQQPAREILIRLHVHVLPLPPRVSFAPSATQEQPLWLPALRRGATTSITVIPHNAGDERLIPLVGHIATREPDASATPRYFHAEEPVTLRVNTSNRPFGKVYDVVFDLRYASEHARGPAKLHLRGEILPTFWQSLLRQKSLTERSTLAILMGLGGGGLGFVLGAWLTTQPDTDYFLLLPFLAIVCTWLASFVVNAYVAHTYRSGNTTIRVKSIHPLIRWGIPVIFALLITLLGLLVRAALPAGVIEGICWSIMGFFPYFMLDKARTPPP